MNQFQLEELAREMWRQLKNQIPNNPVEYIRIGLEIAAKKGYKVE